jgi:hypothetical protein
VFADTKVVIFANFGFAVFFFLSFFHSPLLCCYSHRVTVLVVEVSVVAIVVVVEVLATATAAEVVIVALDRAAVLTAANRVTWLAIALKAIVAAEVVTVVATVVSVVVVVVAVAIVAASTAANRVTWLAIALKAIVAAEAVIVVEIVVADEAHRVVGNVKLLTKEESLIQVGRWWQCKLSSSLCHHTSFCWSLSVCVCLMWTIYQHRLFRVSLSLVIASPNSFGDVVMFSTSFMVMIRVSSLSLSLCCYNYYHYRHVVARSVPKSGFVYFIPWRSLSVCVSPIVNPFFDPRCHPPPRARVASFFFSLLRLSWASRDRSASPV